MDRDKFLELVQKLPPGTNILVRGGAAASDDAWNPTIRVFASPKGAYKDGESYLGYTAVVEMDMFNTEHYNYPEGYSGSQEVTGEFFPETLKYEPTEEEKTGDKIAAFKSYRARTGCDLATAKAVLQKHWYKDE